MRRAARQDDNHGEIAAVLRAAGFSVQDLSGVGGGCPDLLVACGDTFCVEIKDGTKPPSERRFTPAQKRWHANWRGRAHVVESVEQALLLVDLYRRAKAA